MEKKPLLLVENYGVQFKSKGNLGNNINAVSDVNLKVEAGEIVAVVGSSGSGKSILAHGILGILPQNVNVSGKIYYNGEELTPILQKKLRGKEISLIPQSIGFLDPVMNVGNQISADYKNKVGHEKVGIKLERLGLPREVGKMHPFQLSGGMARRVLIGGAIIQDCKLIIADEPTTGLDLDRAVSSLKILKELADSGAGVVLITHDIDLAVNIADKISVFYGGITLENVPASFFGDDGKKLKHPYSKALFDAMPQNGFKPLRGKQPLSGESANGCIFSYRCDMKKDECMVNTPPFIKYEDREVRCFYGA